jgi:hypothetical protein
MTRNGQIRYELKTPWRNGTTHVLFEPRHNDVGSCYLEDITAFEFIEK